MPKEKVLSMMERYYGDQVDGTTQFYEMIAAQLRPNHLVLDLGCGYGREETDVRSKCACVIGCDVGDDVSKNHFISAGVQGDGYKLPFASRKFDVVIMDYVFEHLQYPEKCASEVFRVLKSGGRLFFRTPNFYHYVAVTAYLTPHWFHRIVVPWLANVSELEPFETYYRANTRNAVVRILSNAGFAPEQILMVEKEPHYLTFSKPTFLMGYYYERAVNKFEMLENFRSSIFGVFSKSL